MDYAASLRNIEILKNFIRPYNCRHIHFDFFTSTNFKAQIFNEIDSEFIEANVKRCHIGNIPCARILVDDKGLEILYYFDGDFHYEYDLVINRVIAFQSLSNSDFKSGNIKLQLLDLIRQLKNSG